jgi:hypothetical protein
VLSHVRYARLGSLTRRHRSWLRFKLKRPCQAPTFGGKWPIRHPSCGHNFGEAPTKKTPSPWLPKVPFFSASDITHAGCNGQTRLSHGPWRHEPMQQSRSLTDCSRRRGVVHTSRGAYSTCYIPYIGTHQGRFLQPDAATTDPRDRQGRREPTGPAVVSRPGLCPMVTQEIGRLDTEVLAT